MSLSVHDNILLSYTVFSREKEIRLQTAYLDSEPNEYTEVIFSDVVAYDFESDSFNTVLFDISKIDIEDIYEMNTELFNRLKDYGWPSISYQSKEDLLLKLKAIEAKGYLIESSCGLCGWVIAHKLSIKPTKPLD